MSNQKNTRWSSRMAFIMASAGAAVGLGNIWRFPYITGQHGGAAFVLLYVAFIIVLGIPLMMSEVLIGRRGRGDPASAVRAVAIQSQRSKHWQWIGILSIFSGFLILSFYFVIAGWVLDFLIRSAMGMFTGASVQHVGQIFNGLLGNPVLMLLWDTIVVIAAVFIIARGINKGLEKVVYIMFPALLFLIIILTIYSVESGGFGQGFRFLFQPDFSQLTAQSVLLALGQAFFSLGIALGIMMMFGAYLTSDISIPRTIIIVAATDTLVAILAGLTIFPVVFANGLEPSAGPSLIFKTLPVAFGHMRYGEFFGSLFFLMLEFAAFTSAIALLEPTVVWLMRQFSWRRPKATISAGFVLWVLSIGTVFSFNIGSHIQIFGKTFFDLLDYLTSNILLPLGGLLIAIFTGWVMHKQDTISELKMSSKSIGYRFWRFSMRYIVPVAIVIIFLNSLGVI